MILIGSRALNHYLPIERKMHDWDLIPLKGEEDLFKTQYYNHKVKTTDSHTVYDINGIIVELQNSVWFEISDIMLLKSKNEKIDWIEIDSPFGKVSIPPIQILYDIKKATSIHINEPKHKYDLELIKSNFTVIEDTQFFEVREKEIKYRIEKSNKIKHDFFHKYHIPEYIEHDRLHDMYADLLDLNMPTYKRITTAETNISEELFNNLTHDQKISLMTEEVLVLNLERWFIPQMIENGINYKLIDHFYNNNEAMPTYQILKHVCITGLKGEADYITNFSRDNFFAIELEWIKAKEKIKTKGGLPELFLNELFDLRKKYLNKEKVGLHHL